MPDREKVLKGLICCTNGENNVPRCEKCPYADEHGTCDRLDELHLDALELLKEQEGIIKQYKKADGFLFAHGWKWEGR